jgi:acetylornithine deacetylase/succinyl-diaminopimelate desuccinylase-like protein
MRTHLAKNCHHLSPVLALVAAATLLPAQDSVPEVARLLSDVVRVDTSNPPGNEGKLAELLKSKLAPLGFAVDIIPTPTAGKAHLVARLRGDGSKRPVLIASHGGLAETSW